MSQQRITNGPGNLVPFTEKRKFLANEAFERGDIVTLTGTTGYTIAMGSAILMPIGVAAEAIDSGAWGDVIISGYCDYLTNNGDNVGAYAMLFSAADGECDSIAYGANAGIEQGGIFGMSLEAETGTTCTNAYIFCSPTF